MRGRRNHARVVEQVRVEKLAIGQLRRTGVGGKGRRDTAASFAFVFRRLLLLLFGGRSTPQLSIFGASVLKPDLDLSFGQADVGRDGRFALRRDVRSSFVLRLQFDSLFLRVDRSVFVACPRLTCTSDKTARLIHLYIDRPS